MALGDEYSQTLQADGATHTLTIEGRPAGGYIPKIIASIVTGKKADFVSTARRANLTVADTPGDLSLAQYGGVGSINMGNSMHVALSAAFSVASQTATIFLLLIDSNDSLIGITRDYTFKADAYYRSSSNGVYYAPMEIVDAACACYVFPVLRIAPMSGSVSIYGEVL
jgi:hypothetical protein